MDGRASHLLDHQQQDNDIIVDDSESLFHQYFGGNSTHESLPVNQAPPAPTPPIYTVNDDEEVRFVACGKSELPPKRPRRSELRSIPQTCDASTSQAFFGVTKARHEMVVNRMCDMLRDNQQFSQIEARNFQKLCQKREAILQEAPEHLRPVLMESEPALLREYLRSKGNQPTRIINRSFSDQYIPTTLPSRTPSELNVQMLQARGIYPPVLEPNHEHELRRLADWYRRASEQQRADFNHEPMRYVMRTRETNYGTNVRRCRSVQVPVGQMYPSQRHSVRSETSSSTSSIYYAQLSGVRVLAKPLNAQSTPVKQQTYPFRQPTRFQSSSPIDIRVPSQYQRMSTALCSNQPRPIREQRPTNTETNSSLSPTTHKKLQSFEELNYYLSHPEKRTSKSSEDTLSTRQSTTNSSLNSSSTSESTTKSVAETPDTPRRHRSIYSEEFMERVKQESEEIMSQLRNQDLEDETRRENEDIKIIGVNCDPYEIWNNVPELHDQTYDQLYFKNCDSLADIARYKFCADNGHLPQAVNSMEEAEKLIYEMNAPLVGRTGTPEIDEDDPWNVD
ncbi:hypothetical protein ACOME3_000332 [Neoechinorhynchus agilis]